MALKLIERFEVSDDELNDLDTSDKPIYTEENLLFETDSPDNWKNVLALIVANKYDCYAIKEECIASTGERTFNYFVYGEPEDILIAKELFKFVYSKLDSIIKEKCFSKGEVYTDSFSEGIVEGIRYNVESETFSFTGIIKTKESVDEEKKDAILQPEKIKIKPPPIENKTNVSSNEKELDYLAYFTGEGYGRAIHISNDLKNKFNLNVSADVFALRKLLDL